MAQVIKNRLVKLVLRFVLFLFLLLFSVAGAIQFPYVQTKLVNYISEKYSVLLGYEVTLQRISIWWFDSVEIEEVNVIDPEGNTMIYSKSIEIDFDLFSLFNKTDHHVDDIILNGSNVYLTKINIENDSLVSLNINDFVRRIKAQTQGKEPTRVYLSCDNIALNNATFNYNDQLKDSIRDKFDYYHFTIDSINGRFNKVFTVRDTFGLHVNSLRGVERNTSLRLNKMVADFAVSQRAMEFDNMQLETAHSTIKDSIRFEYSSTADFSDFNNKILINGHLNNATIDTRDLVHFAPQIDNFKEKYVVTGDINGLVRALRFRNCQISFGTGTTLRGQIRMNGLPNVQETFVDFDLSNSYITMSDLRPYVKEKTYSRLAPFEHIGFSAEFLGFPNDFVARGSFYTEYGRIDSDINLKIAEDISKSSYSGQLSMENFDLGGYFDEPLMGFTTLSGNISGQGFTLETADFKLNGEIENLGLYNYDYHNIVTNARFTKEFFEGTVDINDENLKLNLVGSIDLRGGLDFFNLRAELDTVNLQTLHLSEEKFIVKSDLYVNARGLQVDEVLGAANLGKTYLEYKDKSIQIDSLSIISDKDEDKRIILLETNLLDATMTGKFELTQLYKSLKTLVKEYQLSLKNDSDDIKKYYAKKSNDQEDYSVQYNININDLNPLLDVFVPELFVSANSKINGSLTGGYTSIISIDTKLDSLIYDNNTFLTNDVQVNVSKISDSTNVLAMVYLASENQNLSGITTKDLLFEGIWDNNHIDFEFDIFQTAYENRALLYGAVDFKLDTVDLRIESSDLKILDKQWDIAQNNKISIAGKEILVNQFKVSNGLQSLLLEGAISEDQEKRLTLTLDSLGLDNLNTVLNKNLDGKITGFAQLQDYYGNTIFLNKLELNGLEIDDFLIGDISARSTWNNLRKQSYVNCNLRRQGFKIFDLQGVYSPFDNSKLDLTAALNGTDMRILEPFFASYFSEVDGELHGNLRITGTLDKPAINGGGDIRNAGLTVNYLNTAYTFNGNFNLSPTRIGFSNVALLDQFGNQGALNGYIGHDNFKNFSLNINSEIQNLQVLNTTSKDNELFYGTGIASGTIQFVGPTTNLNIIASAKTEKGTKIYIPIGDTETIEQEEYINFVDFNAKADTDGEDEIQTIDLRGIKLDFDLDITSDAYCEIIFDIKSGDIIRGRGNGDLKLEIDTKGEFNMFGDYNIEQGGYNFTLYNLINKEFEILQGSKISWYGDPYQGILDISASYNQLASFLPLISDNNVNGDFDLDEVVELRRKYPVNVLLDIDGALLSPTVDFDISTGTLPRNIQLPNGDVTDLEFEFLRFKNSIDEQELKRQVFSLIVLRRFSPLQSFNTGGSITSSVSELLSNQLSYWITQVDENLEIDVDFGKLDDEAFNTFQLRLSYSFFDGRLRVTRDGGFTNQANRADVSSIAGDWTVEYLLTDDGKFKVKMYNRTNFNPINPTEENQNTITTGFSLIHTQSFDEIKDLFKKSREKAKEKDEGENEESLFINTEASLPKDEEYE